VTLTRRSAAATPAPTTIVFGTDGWRARIADEFTYDNVRRCADGVAEYVEGRGESAKGVVIAYDRRFSSEFFAIAAAEVLLARDIPVAYAVHAVPTQMSSFEVIERGAAAGIVITASHNPWVDNGFKVKAPTGAAAGAEILGFIESRLATNGGIWIDRRPFGDAEAAGLAERFDPFEGYERHVRRSLDLDALRAADASILVDPMWGAGSGWPCSGLAECSGDCSIGPSYDGAMANSSFLVLVPAHNESVRIGAVITAAAPHGLLDVVSREPNLEDVFLAQYGEHPTTEAAEGVGESPIAGDRHGHRVHREVAPAQIVG